MADYLLIEPVWNRNWTLTDLNLAAQRTFNRTSMESKLVLVKSHPCAAASFNRTSMESKPTTTLSSELNRSDLLIEPVWNRNLGSQIASTSGDMNLLIEPVWNRNDSITAMISRLLSAF